MSGEHDARERKDETNEKKAVTAAGLHLNDRGGLWGSRGCHCCRRFYARFSRENFGRSEFVQHGRSWSDAELQFGFQSTHEISHTRWRDHPDLSAGFNRPEGSMDSLPIQGDPAQPGTHFEVRFDNQKRLQYGHNYVLKMSAGAFETADGQNTPSEEAAYPFSTVKKAVQSYEPASNATGINPVQLKA
ncbi:hypothetical protein VQ056_25560 [Paenibacillus sp. JTLBN-2024]